jgi:hypothetical protein
MTKGGWRGSSGPQCASIGLCSSPERQYWSYSDRCKPRSEVLLSSRRMLARALWARQWWRRNKSTNAPYTIVQAGRGFEWLRVELACSREMFNGSRSSSPVRISLCLWDYLAAASRTLQRCSRAHVLITLTFRTMHGWSQLPQRGDSSGRERRAGLQLWRVATNMLSKQPRTNDKGWSTSLSVGSGANNQSP